MEIGSASFRHETDLEPAIQRAAELTLQTIRQYSSPLLSCYHIRATYRPLTSYHNGRNHIDVTTAKILTVAPDSRRIVYTHIITPVQVCLDS